MILPSQPKGASRSKNEPQSTPPSVYKAIVSLRSQVLESGGNKLKLLPGMQVVAEINSGQPHRSAIPAVSCAQDTGRKRARAISCRSTGNNEKCGMRHGLLMLLLLGASHLAMAADLLEIYHQAQVNNPTLKSRQGLAGVREKLTFPQALATDLPNVTLSGGNNVTHAKSSFNGAPEIERSVSAWNWSLQLTQPIMRPQNLLAYYEAEAQDDAASAQFAQAEQGPHPARGPGLF